jgi:hypothetical protein
MSENYISGAHKSGEEKIEGPGDNIHRHRQYTVIIVNLPIKNSLHIIGKTEEVV